MVMPILSLVVAAVVTAAAVQEAAGGPLAGGQKPNIFVMLVDDLGMIAV
jgi:hypothetical protein